MEEVRKEKYPNSPSRLSSLYVSNTLDEAENGTIDKNKNLELAENYWKYKENLEGTEPIVEILASGKIKVIEIINKNNKI